MSGFQSQPSRVGLAVVGAFVTGAIDGLGNVGLEDGSPVGVTVGLQVGDSVGFTAGLNVGDVVGDIMGFGVGLLVIGALVTGMMTRIILFIWWWRKPTGWRS